MNEERHNGIESAIAAGITLEAQDQLDKYGLAVIPKDTRIEDLERYQESPRRIRSKLTFRDIESFDHYFKRFSDPHSSVFADLDAARFLAVLDYHVSRDGMYGTPAHCDHTATLVLTETDEWKAWSAKDESGLTQFSFAEFVEQHIEDIVEPAGAAMLESVRHIQATRNVEFGSKVDLDNGDLVFNFSSETKGKGNVSLPERFTLGIAPFEGSDPYKVQARLRYRIGDDGALTLWYQLIDADDVRKDAVKDVLHDVREIAGEDRVYVGSLT